MSKYTSTNIIMHLSWTSFFIKQNTNIITLYIYFSLIKVWLQDSTFLGFC